MKSRRFLPLTFLVLLTVTISTYAATQASTDTSKNSNQIQAGNTVDTIVKKSQQYISDSMITAQVKAIFLKEEFFGSKKVFTNNIQVVTIKGVVWLHGVAESEQEINNAIELAKTVSGVKEVKSEIKLRNQSAATQ